MDESTKEIIKPEEKPLATREEIIAQLRSPFKSALNEGGIDKEFLITQLKREFNNSEPKLIKVKGAVNAEELPEGYKVIATSGCIEKNGEGFFFGDGETLIECSVHDINVSQRARIDVHKLRGDYTDQTPADLKPKPLVQIFIGGQQVVSNNL